MKALLPYLKMVWVSTTLVVVISLLLSAMLFVNPWISMRVYEDLVKVFDQQQIESILLALIILAIGVACLEGLKQVLASHIRTKIVRTLRLEMVEDVLHYPFDRVHKEDSGGIVQRIMMEVEILANLIAEVGNISMSIAQLVGVYGFLFFMESKVFFMALGLTACNMLWTFVWKHPLQHLNRSIGLGSGSMISDSHHFFHAVKQIKCFNMYEHYLDRMEKALFQLKKRMLRRDLIDTFLKQGAAIQVSLGATFLIVIVYWGVKTEAMSLGQYVFLGLLIHFTSAPIIAIAQFFSQYQMGIVAIGRMQEIKGLTRESTGELSLHKVRESISVKDVWFAYEAEDWILKGVSMNFPAGSNIALVGLSGSGKSTIINILLRLFAYQKGEVLIDGHELEEYRLKDLRNSIGYIPQWTHLFEGSIRDNIDPKGSMTDEDVLLACETAQIMDLISKTPEGIYFQIAEHGANLSGGERQRISLARALAREPQILLLDEPTSAVDPETEGKIRSNLQKLREIRPEMTVITISHNYNLVRHSNYVYALSDGVIVQEGKPEELAIVDDYFSRLFHLVPHGGF